jgi:hypothetical protein
VISDSLHSFGGWQARSSGRTSSGIEIPNPTNGALTIAYALSSDMDIAIRGLNAAVIYGMKFELGADVLFRKVVVLE